MRTADISTNFHQCCAAETLCSAAVSPQLTVYVLDNSCTRTACSCTGVQIVSSHILTDVTVAVTKKLGGRVPLGPHGCCAYATVVVLHCVTGVTGPSGSTPSPSPSRKIFSSDLGESHGLAGLGLWGQVPPSWLRHCCTVLCLYTFQHCYIALCID